MSSVKELLKKIINEEIDTMLTEERGCPPGQEPAMGAKGRGCSPIPGYDEWKKKQAAAQKAATKKTPAGPYYAQTEEGKCEKFGGTWNPLAGKCIMPPSAKGKGAGKGKRKWNTKCRCAKFGCKTKLVGWIQDQFGIKVDDKFGPGTRRTVMRWQKKNGLKPDGIVCPGGKTITKLKAKGPQDLIGMEKVKDLTGAEAAALEKKRAATKGPITGSKRQYMAVALKGIYQVTGRRTEKNEERARDLLQSFWPTISKAIANKDPEVTRNGKPSIVKIRNYARDLVQAGWSPSPTTAP